MVFPQHNSLIKGKLLVKLFIVSFSTLLQLYEKELEDFERQLAKERKTNDTVSQFTRLHPHSARQIPCQKFLLLPFL